jgi:carbon storage regulator CsrA
MLVLGRKQGQGVTARLPDGSEIRVVVVDIRDENVRLGFEADFRVQINRDEIWAKMERNGEIE